ncbi:hypothetical protein CONLIGDRAFT_708937 [Coniochaeta ligniaria NRRL 30616]|uniref:Cora-domain-containing protein n=1 Tax=Coniochaeta ligniaria NRRL 30616 TaxID=1408157 RepID=A0A1J7IF54_9PEZI|nr:hypothetical protein CONLIGDRAFT_708937 [Coniochaeta ligniaria NRRL 30616]
MPLREQQSRHYSDTSSRVKSTRGSIASPDQAYARKIQTHSQLSTESCFYSFLDYANLADYLNAPYYPTLEEDLPPSFSQEEAQEEAYIVITTYAHDGSTDRIEVATVDELTSTLDRISTQFYRRHLDFREASGRNECFSDVTLPSSGSHMIQLWTTTLGTRSTHQHSSFQEDHENLDDLRSQTSRMMRSYIEKISVARAQSICYGDSIVRDFALHDRSSFSIEQAMSIYVSGMSPHVLVSGNAELISSDQGLVWLDYGRNLGHSEGPWLPDALKCTPMLVRYWPTSQHRPGLILKTKAIQKLRKEKSTKPADNEIAQTARLLHEEYGCLLNSEVMAQDPFYALTDIFRFAASSEAQFLEMMQSLLHKEMDPMKHRRGSGSGSVDKTLVMWNLVYNKQLTERHLQRLTKTVEFIEARMQDNTTDNPIWPQPSTESARNIASKSARLLLADYRHLVRRATVLREEFVSSMTILMNAAAIDESQKAIAQAEGVAKLTTLAFFFVPLSFTTSVFGMNFRELSDGNHLSLWVWSLTAARTLILTYLALQWFALKHKLRSQIECAATSRFGISSTKSSRDGSLSMLEYLYADLDISNMSEIPFSIQRVRTRDNPSYYTLPHSR